MRDGFLVEFIVGHKTHGVLLDDCVDSLGLCGDLEYLCVDLCEWFTVVDGFRFGVVNSLVVLVVCFLLSVV